MNRFIRIRPTEPQVHSAIGQRLRLECEPGELAILAEERTLPEQVANPDANRIEVEDRIWLTRNDVRWLHSVLGALIAEQDETDPLAHHPECNDPYCGGGC